MIDGRLEYKKQTNHNKKKYWTNKIRTKEQVKNKEPYIRAKIILSLVNY